MEASLQLRKQAILTSVALQKPAGLSFVCLFGSPCVCLFLHRVQRQGMREIMRCSAAEGKQKHGRFVHAGEGAAGCHSHRAAKMGGCAWEAASKSKWHNKPCITQLCVCVYDSS